MTAPAPINILTASQRRAAQRQALALGGPVARVQESLATLEARLAEVTGLVGEASLGVLEAPSAEAKAELDALEQELATLKTQQSRAIAALAAAQRRASEEGRAALAAACKGSAAKAKALSGEYAKAASKFDKALPNLVSALVEMNDLGRQIARACWDAGFREDGRFSFNLNAAAMVLASRMHEARVADHLAPLIDIGGRVGSPDLVDLVARQRGRLELNLGRALGEED